jgi:hypothetical protein
VTDLGYYNPLKIKTYCVKVNPRSLTLTRVSTNYEKPAC